MPREVEAKRTRKARRLIRKLAESGAEAVDPETGEVKAGVDYSSWESAFLSEVDQRLEKYGSAFANLSKGRKEDALSLLQAAKLKEIAAKARGQKRKGLAAKKPSGWKKRARADRA